MKIENVKWLTIIGLVIIIVLMQQCSGSSSGDCPEVRVDSVVVETLVPGEQITVTRPGRPVYITIGIPVPDTITVIIDNDTLVANSYTADISDTLISGSITSVVDGTLISQSLNYIPIVKEVSRVDTLKKDKTITNTVTKVQMVRPFVGMEVGGSQTVFDLSPNVSFVTRNGYNYQYRYGLLTKTHHVTVQKELSFRRKKK